MKKIMIAFVAVLVLGGGAAGAYFYFDKPAEAAAGPEDEAKKAEHDAKVEGSEHGVVEEFVALDVLILPIIDDSGVTQTVTLMVSIATPDKTTAAEVKRLSPRLKDAFIQDMYGMLNNKNSMKDGLIQVGALKERLNRVSLEVLGEDLVNDVLLQIVQQRPVS